MKLAKIPEQYTEYINRLFQIDNNDSAVNERSLVRTITFQVTDACNLCCSYCYQINKHKNRMKFETSKKFIDLLLSADENANYYINPTNAPAIVIEFIGGEPLLEIDLIDQITDYFIEQMIVKNHKWATRFRISICSNGVLYFDDRVQKYLKKHMHHLSFSVSIDGNKVLHDACRVFPDGSGSYDIAVKAAMHFHNELSGYLGSKLTIAPANVSFLYDAVLNMINLGYKDIYLNCVYEKGWEVYHATMLYNQLKKIADYVVDNNLEDKIYLSIFSETIGKKMPETMLENWCGGTGYMISCDYKGDIYPCIRYMESSLGDKIKPVIIGDVNNGIMCNSKQKDIVKCMKCITRKSQSTDECFNCPIGEGCAWCSAYNYQEFGTMDKRATYICEMHKARVLANVYYWNRIYVKNNEPLRFKNNLPKEWSLEIVDEKELELLTKLERNK